MSAIEYDWYEKRSNKLSKDRQLRYRQLLRRPITSLNNREKIDLAFFKMVFWGSMTEQEMEESYVFKTGKFTDISLYCAYYPECPVR